jgi:hypothetical protein
MKKTIFFIIILAVLFLSQLSFAEKRQGYISMKDLTNPKSPSYVPYPYPKTESEVIADLKYVINKRFGPSSNTRRVLLGKPPDTITALPNLLEKNSAYKIGKIFKVKHHSIYSQFGYKWFISVLRKDGVEAVRVVLDETGIYAYGLYFDSRDKPVYPVSEEEVLLDLSNTIGEQISKKDVKTTEFVAYTPLMGQFTTPTWEITLSDGRVFYYNDKIKRFYKNKKELKWEKDAKGQKPFWRNMVTRKDIIALNEVDDKILFYEEVKKKSN